MTFEDFIIALSAEAPNLPANGLRLLLHLVAKSIQAGSHSVSLSDRDIAGTIGIGRGHVCQVKKSIGHLVEMQISAGRTTTFKIPASWYPLQASLFSSTSGTGRGPLLAPNGGHHWHRPGATTGTESGPSGTHRGPEWHPQGAGVAPNGGQVAPTGGRSGTEWGPPATENQQLTNAGDDRSRSIDLLTTSEKYVKIDLVLNCVEIPSSLRSDAELLRNNMWVYAQQRGSGSIAERQPSDEVVAKCLSIGGVDSLLIALGEASNYKNSRPASYWWFVAVFLQKLHGIDPSMLKERLDSRKFRKQPRRAELLPFPDQLVQQAAGQVKSLR